MLLVSMLGLHGPGTGVLVKVPMSRSRRRAKCAKSTLAEAHGIEHGDRRPIPIHVARSLDRDREVSSTQRRDAGQRDRAVPRPACRAACSAESEAPSTGLPFGPSHSLALSLPGTLLDPPLPGAVATSASAADPLMKADSRLAPVCPHSCASRAIWSESAAPPGRRRSTGSAH